MRKSAGIFVMDLRHYGLMMTTWMRSLGADSRDSGLLFQRFFASASVILCLVGGGLHADVTMPPIFGDHMVIQQGMTLPVWGNASPGESVTVSLGSQSQQTVANEHGQWRVTLRPVFKSSEPMIMVINGNNRMEIHDVIAGDLWICAGDGNMSFPLSDATVGKEPLEKLSDPHMRFFNAQTSDSLGNPLRPRWVLCNSSSAPEFSGIGYFFGRDLRSTLHLPIGMIQCTAERSPIYSWISKKGLVSKPSVVPSLGIPRDSLDKSTNFERLVAPMIPYAITGVIWCQGESEEGIKALEYRRLLPRLIRDWRERWGEGVFSFFVVSPAGFGSSEIIVEPYRGINGSISRALPWLCEGTACVLGLPFTGVALASDLGVSDEKFPPDKLDVGRRLALLARHRTYGEEVVDSGPTFRCMRIEREGIRIDFDHCGRGLVLGASPWKSRDDAPTLATSLKGFAVAGSDRKWFPAQGIIDGNSVILRCDAVLHPEAVRYCWKGFPDGNLYNREGLPASPFRTDMDQPE